jgi:uncharacterized protein YprB with RNaseH-like and TPR domain
MLRNTFCHIPTIGPKSERHLWRSGVCSWEDVLGRASLPLSPRRERIVRDCVEASVAQFAAGNAGYFADSLPPAEQWRMFPEFQDSVAYLDIETTGLGAPRDYITTIALYDGVRIRHYVHGVNLSDFCDDIARYRLIVTYNGKMFDVPFIRTHLGVPMEQAHIDLRYVLHSLGYKGGLKGCEHRLGLSRGELEGVDGFFAVLLWADYLENGNDRALETLLAYNIMDAVNLAALMACAYNLKVEQTPFAATHRLALPALPELPFQPDAGTIQRIRRLAYGW